MQAAPRRDPFGPLPPRHPLLALAWPLMALSVGSATLVRLVLAIRLETVGWARDPLGILAALARGAIADTATALVLTAVAVAVAALCARRGLRTVGHLALALGLMLVAFGALAEVVFWEEFAARLNGVAVFYLMYPREVIGNLRESFDLRLYLPPVVAAGALAWWSLRHRIGAVLASSPGLPTMRRLGLAVVAASVGIGLAQALPAPASGNRELDELARNGPASMLRAALTNDTLYDGVYPGIDEGLALALLRDTVAQDNTRFLDPPQRRSIRRWVENRGRERRLNVVVVIDESFGSRFVDVLDDPLPQTLTPNLDRLADESLFFTNVYASGQRSVRGLEAVLTSFTPIPGISTARRPGAEGMHSLPATLGRLGYRTAMLYAGRALFDNMGEFWRGIGFDHVWEQSDIRRQTFTTAWGVCDEDLFTEALERMDRLTADGRPALLSLFTVSNHRPYLFPEDHVPRDPALGSRENTARYADWAFGDFLERARRHRWFDDTVFVFVADHGHKVNGAADVPLHRYRIPMLMYAPKHIAPRRVDTLAAQIDLVPTLLGQLGLSYESSFFGLDLLRVPPGGGRIAVAHNFSVAFARPGHAVVLEPDGSERGYRFTPGSEALPPEAPDPAVSAEARAVTQTAHRMFYAHEYHETAPRLPSEARSVHASTGARPEGPGLARAPL